MIWNKITPNELVVIEPPFPCWLAVQDTGQVHWWRSKRDMETCEPFWRLYTHWAPDGHKPEPPVSVEVEAYNDWYGTYFPKNGYPPPFEAWKAACVWERSKWFKFKP